MPASSSNQTIQAGIVGGTGYTGVELLRLLSQHPNVALKAITSRTEDGLPVAQMFPNLRGMVDLAFQTPEQAGLESCDVVFFATPHGVAMKQAQSLLDNNVRIIDLAADFRLQDTAAFEQWYKMPHACPDILRQSAYGLVELHRARIAQSRVIGNPGCYPTTVLLGLAPLLEGGQPLIDEGHIIADSKSGVSGAGRKAEVGTLFSEAGDNFKAYGVSGHRHQVEITEQLSLLASGRPLGFTFVPHLVPMIRGMLSTIYVRILPHARDTDFQALFEARYADEAFIDVMPAGSLPETRSVRGSNNLRIALHRLGGGDQLVILVVQDNLVKGAAGQAVQNMNLLFGLPETTGLRHVALLP